MQGAAALGQNGLVHLFGVFGDEFVHAVDQRMRQALAHRQGAPFVFLAVVFRTALCRLGDFNQALAGCELLLAVLVNRLAIEHHVLDALAQGRLQVVINADHAGIDNAHVHAGLDGVVQEHGVNRFAHRIVAAKAEGHIGHAARDLGARQVLLDPACGVDEIDRVVVVLFNARGNGKDVRVKDDVFGREVELIDQHAVGALADLNLALIGVGLAFFVKGHDHGRRAITLEQLGLFLEGRQAFLHRDRIDDALALYAAQAGFDHAPLGAVDHDGYARNVGLAGDQVQKAHHGGLAVQHSLVHVDVNDLRAVFDLLAGHGQCGLEVAVEDHAGEGLGARNVGALADVDEQRARADIDRLQAGQLHGRHDCLGILNFRHNSP